MRLVRVAGESMTPSYRPSDLLIARPVPRAGPRRGDVVVLRHGGARMLKRAVGMPGDVVELEAGRLFVNRDSVHGQGRVAGAYTQTWRVPTGHYFVAGDNPDASDDSRIWDAPFVPVEALEWVVARRVGVPRRRRGLTARRPAPAGDRAA